MTTMAACPGRICLVNPVNADPQSRRLLAQIARELAMRPLADLLIGLRCQAYARLDVTNISQRDLAHTFRCTEVHYLPRRLM
jgi:hypothetical protein